MTSDQIVQMSKKVDFAKDLLGKITILKEKIAWMEAKEPLYFAFDRGASKGGVSTIRTEIILDTETYNQVHNLILSRLKVELLALETELEQMSFSQDG